MIRYRTTLLGYLHSRTVRMIIFVRDLLRKRIFALRERMLFLTFCTGASSLPTNTSGKISSGIPVFVRKIFNLFAFFAGTF
jgi:hypothetical protein